MSGELFDYFLMLFVNYAGCSSKSAYTVVDTKKFPFRLRWTQNLKFQMLGKRLENGFPLVYSSMRFAQAAWKAVNVWSARDATC